MRPILSTFLFFTYLFSQENNTQQDSVLQSAEMEPDTTTEMRTPMSNVDPDESVNQVLTSVPLGLDSGYKGFAWGSPSGSTISTIFTPIVNLDTASTDQSFTGILGLDSVKVKYPGPTTKVLEVRIETVSKVLEGGPKVPLVYQIVARNAAGKVLPLRMNIRTNK